MIKNVAMGMALAAVLAGCGRSASSADAALEGGAASVQALGRAVVTAFTAGDTAALQSLRTTEHEHNDVLWPHFPIAKQDSAPSTVAFAWENIQMRNGGAVGEWLGAFRGRQVRFEDASCTGEVEEYGAFQILRGCSVRLTDVAQGREYTVSPFDRVVRMGGVHKVIRYVEID